MSNIKYSYDRCPYNNQKDLAEWALNYFNDPPYKFKSMRIGQLYAIWYSVFDKKKNLSLR